jgi:malonyl-CoA/methylmalonyl-CoA synthetase
MQLLDLFRHSLIGRAGEVGLEWEDGGTVSPLTYTFGELDRRSVRVAHYLAAHGLARGDRLGLYLANRVEFLDLVLACLRSGIILVPINVLYREREMGHLLTDAEPKLVVTTQEGAGMLPAGTPWLDVEVVGRVASALDTKEGVSGRQVLDGETPAAIVYTSGTTGRSKGAVLTHNNFAANALSLLACWRITEADRYLAVLPLFHVHGLGNGVMTWLIAGSRMRLVERFEVGQAVRLFRDFKPTLFFGVPTVYVRLLEIPVEESTPIGQQMRLFVSGSAPLPAPTLTAFEERYGHTILERYGMSETLMNLSNPYYGERRPGSVGFPMPGLEVRILGEDGQEVGVGEIGELVVRGPNVFSGYWRREVETAAAFLDGRWFRTGDLAQCSEDGYYTLRGRRSELIITGGFNLYPREVEDLLLEQPGVREVVVVGIPDARRGEVPVAYYVSETGLDENELEACCRRALASFKVPRAFVRVASLPRNAMGKVQKQLLPSWPPGASP